jgi:hypothetical protein
MAKQTINIGSSDNDGNGSTLRAGGDLINDNFNELYNKLGDGTDLHGLTFPDRTDTVVTRDATETLTNKTIDLSSNTLTGGTVLSFTGDDSTAVSLSLGQDIKFAGGSGITSSVDIATRTITFDTDGAIVTETSTDTLTNKTIAAGDNTITGLTNSNLSGSAGITNANLANSSITIGDEGSNNRTISLGDSLDFIGDSVIGTAINNDRVEITFTQPAIAVGTLTTNTRTATGDGSTTVFTVTNGVNVDQVLVFENGVCQEPTTDYTISGTNLTFGTAPLSGVKIVIREL